MTPTASMFTISAITSILLQIVIAKSAKDISTFLITPGSSRDGFCFVIKYHVENAVVNVAFTDSAIHQQLAFVLMKLEIMYIPNMMNKCRMNF